MVPAPSHRVPRAPWYSGSRSLPSSSAYGAFTLSGRPFQRRSASFPVGPLRLLTPARFRAPVWAPPVSLAATPGITFVFFSSGYLDVSVRRVPPGKLWIHLPVRRLFLRGLPHSDTCGSSGICPSPQLFAACRVFLRPPVPRHPPCALSSLAIPASLAWGAGGSLPAFPAGSFLFSFFLVGSLSVLCFFSVFGFQGTSRRLPGYGDGEIRTLDPLLARQVLSQLSYAPLDAPRLPAGLMGLSGLEPPTSRLSGVRSNRLSYKPRLDKQLRAFLLHCLHFFHMLNPCGLFLFSSGSRLLSHTVSSTVSSAAGGLTIVFGMGTGVSLKRIVTRNP